MEITAELKGHFMRLYQMALTDGDFSPSEWKLLYHFAEERGVPSEQLDRLLLTASGNVAIPETLQSKVDYLHDLCTM
ncbi:MAG: hypothetical protein KDC03_22060, partial [Flavobacteriales bacterium]|nr:hypothetical protein [Flavobacteriales bacterium]